TITATAGTTTTYPATATVTFQSAFSQTLANGANHTVTLALANGNLSITIDNAAPTTRPATTFSAITLTGGNQTNTLIGPNADGLWSVTSANAGRLVVTGLAAFVDFTNFQNLTGGSGVDRFVLNAGSVDGTIDGGAGVDSLQALAPGNDWKLLTGPTSGTL